MTRILPDDYDLTFAVELWLPNDSGVEQTLARCAKQTHAYILFDRIKAEYPNRILRIRQKARVIQEVLAECPDRSRLYKSSWTSK